VVKRRGRRGTNRGRGTNPDQTSTETSRDERDHTETTEENQ